MDNRKRKLLLISAPLLLCFPAAAQDATAGQNTVTFGGPAGPITWNISTHTLTISNTVDVSQAMVACSQYNQYGQCQGSPQSYYHTATGSVRVYNLTQGTSASASDQKTGAVMNSSVSIAANPGDILSIDETQTIFCPMANQIVSNISPPTIEIEAAFTNAYWNGPAPSCSVDYLGVTHCLYLVHNNCTAATTPPDYSMENKLLSDYPTPGAGYLSWTAFAACIRFATSGPWICSHGGAFETSLNSPMPPYKCTHNP